MRKYKYLLKIWGWILLLLFGGGSFTTEAQTLHNPFSSLLPVSQKKQPVPKRPSTKAPSPSKAISTKKQSQKPSSLKLKGLILIGNVQWADRKLALIQKKEQRYWLEEGHRFEALQVLKITSNSVLFQNAQGEVLHLKEKTQSQK